MLLDQIKGPNDVKKINPKDYKRLAKEIRYFLLKNVSKTGGHLASNLGVVELTMALHLALDLPKDQLIFDVGHQSYVHKILTGRKSGFSNLRQFHGMSGFPKPKESKCDAFHSGHSSMSLGVALGMVEARQRNHTDETIVAVIGDGAFTGGMTYEALNNMVRLKQEKKNLIVILNDNKMSISENVGGVPAYLNHIRTKKAYVELKDNVEESLAKVPVVGNWTIGAIKKTKASIKQLVVPGMIFEDMGITYVGPIDGHDIPNLVRMIEQAKCLNEPIILHVITKKGKGYRPSEKKPSVFHGVGPFDLKNGKVTGKISGKSYTDIFSETLMEEAKKEDKIVAVTAAMPEGTGLMEFGRRYPDRFFDVGIAEQHGVTFCAGMAARGLKPVFAVYSTFLQRGFDQMIHDVAIGNYPVVFGVDRSGLVGSDGETHQGIFDIPYLSMIPNMTVLAPINGLELKKMVSFALKECKGPVAIKYARGAASDLWENDIEEIQYGKGQVLQEGEDVVFVGVGNIMEEVTKAAKILEDNGRRAGIVNPRFIKPLDHKLLDSLMERYDKIVVVEEGILQGGFGSSVLQYAMKCSYKGTVMTLGIEDQFVEQGSIGELRKMLKLDGEGIAQAVQ